MTHMGGVKLSHMLSHILHEKNMCFSVCHTNLFHFKLIAILLKCWNKKKVLKLYNAKKTNKTHKNERGSGVLTLLFCCVQDIPGHQPLGNE